MSRRKATAPAAAETQGPQPARDLPEKCPPAVPSPVMQVIQQLEAARTAEEGQDARRIKETAHTLRDMGRYLEAMSLVMEGIKLYPEYTDLYFLFGTLNMDLGQVQEAEEAFRACLMKGEAIGHYASTRGVGSFLAHYNLGMIYEMTGTPQRAATHYCEAARAGYAPAEVRARLLGKVCRLY